nr:neurotrophin 1-like [Danaus plexippus plexippus]
MEFLFRFVFGLTLIAVLCAEDDLKDFEFSEPNELLIAQESRHYENIVKPPVTIIKPTGVTNSHRPQYNLDSMESDQNLKEFEVTTKKTVVKNYKDKESMVKNAVLRALERKDHVGKFAEIIPIIRAMSGNQRVTLASLVASQVTTPPGRQPLNLSQVRSMLNNETSDLMLPILLDTANLIRRAIRPGKETREVKTSNNVLQRRSFTEELDDNPFDTGAQENIHSTRTPSIYQKLRNRPPRLPYIKTNMTNQNNSRDRHVNLTQNNKEKLTNNVPADFNNNIDLETESSNQTLADLPIPEKLRSFNRYIDRKGNLMHRNTFPVKPTAVTRRSTEPTSMIRRRPVPSRKLTPSSDHTKCELFTNTLCLHSEDYPMEAIVQSIRRNKAAATALLADFEEPSEGAVDGITQAQEAKYTAEHYLVSNRRGDTDNRDFAGAGEAGFMCPSTVKYARPQRARATSGQWKYIVNTGEHTQTLRLEKCLKPKESCTYLTDNFKSKCVQVYNYHRLLTWDQQNGLHMDIFKVPTCCSCHIEGYSVSFPPLGQRVHETSSEQFPGEDLSSDHGNQAFESVQPTIQRPTVTKSPSFIFNKPQEGFSFSDNHNLIPGSSLNSARNNENDDYKISPSNPMDSYGNTYFSDSFNQATSVRSIKRPINRKPVSSVGSDTLPSYLEPPTPSAPSSFSFNKEGINKFKILDGSQYKRNPLRPNRRPIRKKISSGPEDLMSSGTSAIGSYASDNSDSFENINESQDEPEININKNHHKIKATIAPKLVSVTSERNIIPHKQQEQHSHDEIGNGKKVNYNYHPIIDFFDEDVAVEDSIDREDSKQTYMNPAESEWKPINHQFSSDSKNANAIGRKKH